MNLLDLNDDVLLMIAMELRGPRDRFGVWGRLCRRLAALVHTTPLRALDFTAKTPSPVADFKICLEKAVKRIVIEASDERERGVLVSAEVQRYLENLPSFLHLLQVREAHFDVLPLPALTPIVEKLPNLETLKIDKLICQLVPQQHQDVLVDNDGALTRLSKLRSLRVDVDHCTRLQLPFQSLFSLEIAVFDHWRNFIFLITAPLLEEAVGNCRSLRALTLGFFVPFAHFQCLEFLSIRIDDDRVANEFERMMSRISLRILVLSAKNQRMPFPNLTEFHNLQALAVDGFGLVPDDRVTGLGSLRSLKLSYCIPSCLSTIVSAVPSLTNVDVRLTEQMPSDSDWSYDMLKLDVRINFLS